MNDNRESLLAEYEAAATEVNTHVFTGWQSSLITFAAGLAGIAILATAESTLAISIATSGAAFLFVVAIVLSVVHLQREDYVIRLLHDRRRQLEWELNLRTNIYVHILIHWSDHENDPYWQKMDAAERLRLVAKHDEYGSPPIPRGMIVAKVTALLLVLAWILIVAWRWLDYAKVFS